MKKEDKAKQIEAIKQLLTDYSCVYLTETTALNAEKTVDLRRAAFKNDVKMVVVKNTLLKKAMEQMDVDYSGLYEALAGPTTLMLSNTGNAPAKLIKSFRQKKETLPALKAAFVEETTYVGADQLDVLATIKSKNELIAESCTEFWKHYQIKKINNKSIKSYKNGRFKSFCRTIS